MQVRILSPQKTDTLFNVVSFTVNEIRDLVVVVKVNDEPKTLSYKPTEWTSLIVSQ